MSTRILKHVDLSVHRKLGQDIKELEKAAENVLSYGSMFYTRETDKILGFLEELGALKSRLEDQMFDDYPELSNREGFSVYF